MPGFHLGARLCLCGLVGWSLAVALPHSVGDAALTVPPAPKPAVRSLGLPPPPVAKPEAVKPQVGIASWYGKDHNGRVTASGEVFDASKLTAAHRSLPFNTEVKVTNLRNGKSVKVVINDRGPGIKGRAIDLSERAAKQIGMTRKGLARVRIEPLTSSIALE